MRRFFTRTVTALLLLAFCLAAFPVVQAEAAAPAKLPTEGEYTLFTMEINSLQTDPAFIQMESTITLNKDGTGKFVMYDMEEPLPKWTEKNGTITLEASDGSTIEGKLEKGIIELEMSENTWFYYAREGVDTKDFKTSGHPTDSMLYAFFQSINAQKDVHLCYTRHTDYMDSDSDFEIHATDDCFYSQSLIKVSGFESTSATLLKDGAYYSLDLEDKTATILIENALTEMIYANVLLLDGFYNAIWGQVMREDYKVEERELDGVKYKVEVFPIKEGEEEYGQEAAFYFNDKGELIRIVEGASKLMPDMGETVYTFVSLDDKVDKKLFDLSGYKIEKLSLGEETAEPVSGK